MTDDVIVRTKVSFRPWAVPDHATVAMPPQPRQQGMQKLPTFSIGELDREVVDMLALRWLDNLYAQRGEASPFKLNRSHSHDR